MAGKKTQSEGAKVRIGPKSRYVDISHRLIQFHDIHSLRESATLQIFQCKTYFQMNQHRASMVFDHLT